MGGVDIMDQKLTTYTFPHKSCKWYYTLFHRAVEIALVNGYILYVKKRNDENGLVLTPKKIREEVIDGLMENYNHQPSRARTPHGDNKPSRLTERHFAEKLPDGKHRDCSVCSDRAKRRKQTSYCCSSCDNVPLCVESHFKFYHTRKDYRRAYSDAHGQ